MSLFSHVNSPRGAVQGLTFVWDVNTLQWVPMQQPILNVGNVTASFVGTGLALDTTLSSVLQFTEPYTINFDYVGGANIIYIGLANPGSATSASVWQIKKLSYDGSNNITGIAFSGGSRGFAQVWDNRAALSYS